MNSITCQGGACLEDFSFLFSSQFGVMVQVDIVELIESFHIVFLFFNCQITVIMWVILYNLYSVTYTV